MLFWNSWRARRAALRIGSMAELLTRDGILTDEEFSAAKAVLLRRFG
ncbi:hypothetical protein QMK19_32290 [Streptomyces sp. H10-C2]|nr:MULTISPECIES: hypothetical protein [unclassified Streptomyces]MDJ0346567.1 hypothetical protein [Streptomyces sp. PH10-H1]MDJ0374187.1 hypothetical protein [Streptomyces sp. H10-C2]